MSPQRCVCDVFSSSRRGGDAASILPGPPQRTAGLAGTFAGGDAAQRRSRRGEAAGSGAGRPQALEVAEQPPVGLSLALAVRQEADGLLHAAGVAVAARRRAGGRAGLLLLLVKLPGSQIAHRHLQDVRLLLLGVGLLPDELGTQQRLQLLDAGVDAVSAQLLHHRLSQLKKKKKKEIKFRT